MAIFVIKQPFITMKRFFMILAAVTISILAGTLWSVAAWAQTPQEIVDRMEAELNKHDDSEGVLMTIDVKVPIVGTMTSRCYTLGDKTRMEAKMAGVSITTWTDGVTEWTYTDKTNKVTIKKADASSEPEGDMDLFDNITDGYDVSIRKEDAKTWYLLCKKSKANKDKDAPKTLEIAVRKSDYYPQSLTTSMSGFKITMRDISFGVSEKQVTFDIKDYPGATVEDKR